MARVNRRKSSLMTSMHQKGAVSRAQHALIRRCRHSKRSAAQLRRLHRRVQFVRVAECGEEE